MKPATAVVCAAACAVALGMGCPRPPALLPASSLPGCGKDTDCKGSRVCERGQCVDARGDGEGGGSEGGAGTAAPAPGDGGTGDGGVPPIVPPGASSMFHGGWSHNGRSRYRVNPHPPTRIARFATAGTVFSSPAVTDEGLAIFGSHDRTIYAVQSAAAPAEVAAVARWSHRTADLVWCSPALGPARTDGGHPVAYVGSDDDHLYALDATDGSLRWSFTAGPCKRAIGFGVEAARCDVDGVTVGPDGSIYFVADGAYALRPDGTLRWRAPLATHCAGAPAVTVDGSVYFGCQDGRVYALSALDGGRRWDVRTGDDVDGSPAVGADGTIYVGSDDSRLYALTPGGAVRWALKTAGDVRSSPAIGEDGTIYAGSFDGNLYAVHPDGVVAWTFSTADRVLSSPTLDAAGVILFGSEDDRLYALAPDGKLLWSLLLDGDVDGTPAIGPDGAIYVGSDDHNLYILR